MRSHLRQFIDPPQWIGQSLAFHLVRKMRNIRRLAVTVWSFLNSCASDNTSSEIAWSQHLWLASLTDHSGRCAMRWEQDWRYPRWCLLTRRFGKVTSLVYEWCTLMSEEFARCKFLSSDPVEMADAARINVESGAQIIDINMGCPAKKWIVSSQVQPSCSTRI